MGNTASATTETTNTLYSEASAKISTNLQTEASCNLSQNAE